MKTNSIIFSFSLCMAIYVATFSLLFPATTQASVKFLTLPFSDPDIRIQQGYVYDCDPECRPRYGNHKGIDYIKGTIDQSSTWQSFDVRAASDGEALFTKWNPNSKSADERWGNYVRIKHQVGNEIYYTLYAHLDSSTLTENKLIPVKRGDIIGKSGKTGSGSNGFLHLHFEFSKPLWGKGNQIDAYDLNAKRDRYPGNNSYTGMGANNYWLNDPPSIPSLQETKFAVVPPDYDDIGSVLEQLNYQFSEIQFSDLTSLDILSKYKVVFLNCSQYVHSTPQAAAALQQYVQSGGSLYVSDWAYEYIRDAFPGYINFSNDPKVGNAQSVNARVVDEGLSSYINPSTPLSNITLNYDLSGWVVIDSVSPKVKKYIEGSVDVYDNGVASNTFEHGANELRRLQRPSKVLQDKPLVVSFRPYNDKGGNVVFTTFHNEAQQTDIEKRLLNYLALVPITQDQQQQIVQSLTTDNLHLTRTDVNTINPNETSGSFGYSYKISAVGSKLAFILAWPGSALALSVYRPNGALYQKIESSNPPIKIVIPNAEAGDWQYQVTSLYVPYNNYPYVVGIGEYSPINNFLPLITKINKDTGPVVSPTVTTEPSPTPPATGSMPTINSPSGGMYLDEDVPVLSNSKHTLDVLLAAEEETKWSTGTFTSDCNLTGLPSGLVTEPRTSYIIETEVYVPADASGKTCTVTSTVTTYGSVYPQTTFTLSLQFTVVSSASPTPTNTPSPTPAPSRAARLYVTNSKSNTVSVVDTASNAIVGTIPIGAGAQGIAAKADGSRIYSADSAANQVSIIDPAKQKVVATIPVGAGPVIPAVSSGNRLYVTNYISNSVTVINTSDNTIVTTLSDLQSGPWGVAVSPDQSYIAVTLYSTGKVVIYTTKDFKKVTEVSVGVAPEGIAYHPDGSKIYVANLGSNTISIIDANTYSVVDTVPVSHPVQFTFNADASRLYVANDETSASEIDVANGTILRTFTVGAGPRDVEVVNNYLYVTNYNDNTISVVSLESGVVTATIRGFDGPHSIVRQ